MVRPGILNPRKLVQQLLNRAAAAAAVWIPSNVAGLYQWLYDGASTPIEQTSAVTGSPMTVVNSRAGTGDRRELRQGRVAQGDGVADYITFGNVLDYDGSSSGWSVAFDWAGTGTAQYICGKIDGAPTYRGWFIYVNAAGKLFLGIQHNLTGNRLTATTDSAYNDGVRRRFLVTYDGSQNASGVTWYVNGSAVADTDTDDTLTLSSSSSNSLYINSTQGDPGRLNSGAISNFAVWSKELSAVEVTAINDANDYMTPGSVELLAWLSEESGPVAFDSSGNGRHGTYTGTLADIHQPDTGVTYSAANELGYTVADGSTMYAEVGLSTLLTAGTIIPRDESTPAKCCAYDSGGQVDLQYTGQAPYYGRIIQSGAAQGDAAADAIVLPQSLLDALESSGAFTLVCWTDRPTTADTVICRIGDGTSTSSFGLNNISTDMYVDASSGGLRYGQYSSYSDVGVQCLAEVFDGSLSGDSNRLKFYVNGVSKTLTYFGSAIGTTLPATLTGGYILRRQSAATFASSAMWCVAFYSRALSAAEVLAIYESGTYPTDNLEALYPCSNITGTGIVPDVSGNGRHGVISGTIADVRAGRQDVIAWNQLHGFDTGVQFSGASGSDYATATGVTPAAKGKFRFRGIASNIGTAQNLFGSGEAAGNFFTCYVDVSGNIQVSLGSSTTILTSTTTYVDGDYVDVAVLWDDADGSCSLRIDDVQEDSATYTGDLASNTKAIDIGNNNANGTHGEPWNGITISGVMYDTDQTTEINNWTLVLRDENGAPQQNRLTDSVSSEHATLAGNYVTAILPGLNGIGIDGSTAVAYGPGATVDGFLEDGSQLDRSGGVETPLARNVNAIDTSYEVGDGQVNPEFVRETATTADRLLAYEAALTGDDLTNANDYTT